MFMGKHILVIHIFKLSMKQKCDILLVLKFYFNLLLGLTMITPVAFSKNLIIWKTICYQSKFLCFDPIMERYILCLNYQISNSSKCLSRISNNYFQYLEIIF
uniref:Uncharacterized protein n=1 Tax=Cacopsylla melanoneura TaxID=428564 RepID=A0A8D9AXY1_9HEMI